MERREVVFTLLCATLLLTALVSSVAQDRGTALSQEEGVAKVAAAQHMLLLSVSQQQVDARLLLLFGVV